MRKPTNPKDGVGIDKAPLSPVPAPVMCLMGLAMMDGAAKYGRHNYRAAGVLSSVYYDAAMRHLMQWWEGEDIDPDSGLPHLAHALASVAILIDASMHEGMLNDDRPPRTDDGWLRLMHEAAAKINAKYKDRKPPYTQENLK